MGLYSPTAVAIKIVIVLIFLIPLIVFLALPDDVEDKYVHRGITAGLSASVVLAILLPIVIGGAIS